MQNFEEKPVITEVWLNRNEMWCAVNNRNIITALLHSFGKHMGHGSLSLLMAMYIISSHPCKVSFIRNHCTPVEKIKNTIYNLQFLKYPICFWNLKLSTEIEI